MPVCRTTISHPGAMNMSAGAVVLFTETRRFLNTPAHRTEPPYHLSVLLATAVANEAPEPVSYFPQHTVESILRATTSNPDKAWLRTYPVYVEVAHLALPHIAPEAACRLILRALCSVARGQMGASDVLALFPVHCWPPAPACSKTVGTVLAATICHRTLTMALEEMALDRSLLAVARSWAGVLRADIFRAINVMNYQVVDACLGAGVNILFCDPPCQCGHLGAGPSSTHFQAFVLELADAIVIAQTPATVYAVLQRTGLLLAWSRLSAQHMDTLLTRLLTRIGGGGGRPVTELGFKASRVIFLILLALWGKRVSLHGVSTIGTTELSGGTHTVSNLRRVMLKLCRLSVRRTETCFSGMARWAHGAAATTPVATEWNRSKRRRILTSPTNAHFLARIGHPQLAAMAVMAAAVPMHIGIGVSPWHADETFAAVFVGPACYAEPRPLGIAGAGEFAAHYIGERSAARTAQVAALALQRRGGLPAELNALILAILVAPWSRRGGLYVRGRPWRLQALLLEDA